MKKLDKEFIEELVCGDMWNFILVSLFSADSLRSVEDCDHSLRILGEINDAIDGIESINGERKEKLHNDLGRAIEIVRRDREEFSNESKK